MIDLANDTSIGRGFVGTYRDRAMQSHAFIRFVEKGFSGLCFAPRGEAKVNHLAICIDGTLKIAPFATNADVGLVYYPAGDHTVIGREETCQSTLAQRK